jgi:alpha-glucosidase
MTAPDGVIAYRRTSVDDQRVVIVNFTDGEVDVPVDGALTIQVASDGGGEGASYSGTVAASAALNLRARS